MQQELFSNNVSIKNQINTTRNIVSNVTLLKGEVINDRDKFMTGGKAIFTLVNELTKNRYTYKVEVQKKNHIVPQSKKYFFVSVLTGSNNETDYNYIGMLKIENNNIVFYLTQKSKMKEDSVPVKVFSWLLKNFNNLPINIKFYHEGYCARCGRKLTVPESINTGFGPECIKLINNKFVN